MQKRSILFGTLILLMTSAPAMATLKYSNVAVNSPRFHAPLSAKLTLAALEVTKTAGPAEAQPSEGAAEEPEITPEQACAEMIAAAADIEGMTGVHLGFTCKVSDQKSPTGQPIVDIGLDKPSSPYLPLCRNAKGDNYYRLIPVPAISGAMYFIKLNILAAAGLVPLGSSALMDRASGQIMQTALYGIPKCADDNAKKSNGALVPLPAPDADSGADGEPAPEAKPFKPKAHGGGTGDGQRI